MYDVNWIPCMDGCDLLRSSTQSFANPMNMMVTWSDATSEKVSVIPSSLHLWTYK